MDFKPPKFRPAALRVWRRNMLVWSKYMVPSLLFNFGEPILYLLGLGFGLGRFIGEMGGLPYLTFLASGLLASSAMNTASFEALFSVYTRMVPQQTYEGMLATPLEVDDVIAGEILWCATKGTLGSTSILIVAFALGALHDWSAFLCIPLFFLVGMCFSGLALIVTAFSKSYDFFNYYITLFITPMFIFCGVFYPTTTLPAFAQALVDYLPLTHAVQMIRPLATGQPVNNVLFHITVLIIAGGIGFYTAVVLARRRLIQ